jgi:hypothetical protein
MTMLLSSPVFSSRVCHWPTGELATAKGVMKHESISALIFKSRVVKLFVVIV